MDDRAQIMNVLARYTYLLDGARFEELGSLFTTGTVRITGGPHDGRSATGSAEAAALYREIVQRDPETGLTGTRHMIASVHVVVNGDEADAHCYFAVLQQTPSLPLQVVASGYYDDRLRRSSGSWAFASREIVCDQVGDLSQHMR